MWTKPEDTNSTWTVSTGIPVENPSSFSNASGITVSTGITQIPTPQNPSSNPTPPASSQKIEDDLVKDFDNFDKEIEDLLKSIDDETTKK